MKPDKKYKKVLLIDENPVVLKELENILTSVRFKSKSFFSTASVFDFILENPSQIGMLIVNYFLPNQQFKILLEQIKAHEATQFIPVMVIAGSSSEDRNKVLSYIYSEDIDDFIFTPLEHSEVILRCTRLLKLRDEFFSIKDKLEGSNKLISVLEQKLQDTSSLYKNMQKEYYNFKNLLNQKEEHVYTLVHDMKSPLTNIVLGVDLILTGDNTFSADEKEMLEKMKETGLRISKMAQQFLEHMKNDFVSDKLAFENLNPNSIIEILLREFYPEANKKGVLLSLELQENLETVCWDQTLILRLMGNLLDNAIKYSPENEVVTLSLSQNEQETTYHVIDNGPGIKKEDQEKIFEMFYQPENSQKGFGIGLSFSKKVVDKHFGSIKVLSQDSGFGTIFRVILPNNPKKF